MTAPASTSYLLRKGRKLAAVGVKDLCLKAATASPTDSSSAASTPSDCADPREVVGTVGELLREILDPTKPISDPDNVDWIRHILAGGDSFEDFVAKLKVYDDALTCGFVWTSNFVAYRCRTCGVSPCMSLCAECFHQGDHEGHDFNMFRSQAGGACDCGDVSVMHKEGFCTRHGPDHVSSANQIPVELSCVPLVVLPHLLFRLVLQLRSYSRAELTGTFKVDMLEMDGFMEFLQTLTTLGAGFKTLLGNCLSSNSVYEKVIRPTNCKNKKYEEYAANSLEVFLNTISTVEKPAFPRQLGLDDGDLRHESILDEYMFWIVKYEFPQPLVTFLLTMLPDDAYKTAFTNSFIKHYSRMTIALAESGQPQVISNRMVHISVQLFSNDALATSMVRDNSLMHILLGSLHFMMSTILTQSQLKDASGNSVANYHMNVDCGRHVMKDHCYWPIVSDVINLLSHRGVVEYMVESPTLVDTWLEILSLFQGMNVNTRELEHHIEFEPNTYYASFSAELELSASPMWAILAHLKSKKHLPVLSRILKGVLSALIDWMDAINLRGYTSIPPDAAQPYLPSPPSQLQVSFHLSLHRYFAAFLSTTVFLQDKPIEALLPSSDILLLLMSHPLQAQVAFYEIISSLWVRNGLQIKGQAMTYIQCHFCNSTVDLDLFLLQAIACKMEPVLFVTVFLQRFHVWDWMTLAGSHRNSFVEADQELSLLEGALTCLTHLLTFQLLSGMPERELVKKEMVNLVCVTDRTHSQLLEYVPERSSSPWSQNVNMEEILDEVAEFKPPNFGSNVMQTELQQGRYVPRRETWLKLFDPLHTLLRAVHRRDYQSSMDRFVSFLKRAEITANDRVAESVWPPFVRLDAPCSFFSPEEEEDGAKSEEEKKRDASCPVHPQFRSLLSILHNKTLHAVLFIIIYKAYQNVSDVTEKGLHLAVNLLQMALDTYSHNRRPTNPPVPVLSIVPDQLFREWFPSDDIYETLRHEVVGVRVPLPPKTPEKETENMDAGEPESPASGSSTTTPYTDADDDASDSMRIDRSAGETPIVIEDDGDHSNVDNTDDEGDPIVTHPPLHLSALFLPGALNRERRSQRPTPTETLDVNESLLTLLVKLHNRLAQKAASPSRHSFTESTSSSSSSVMYRLPGTHGRLKAEKTDKDEEAKRVGDGPTTLARILDQIAETDAGCREKLSEFCDSLISPPRHRRSESEGASGEPTSELTVEERRKRAKEMQARLMADMAKKQQAFLKFMAETGEDALSDEEDSQESTDVQSGDTASSALPSAVVPKKPKYVVSSYDCCICNQSEPSTPSSPMALVAFQQTTKVLGMRIKEGSTKEVLPFAEDMALKRPPRCFEEPRSRVSDLKNYFRLKPSILAVGEGSDASLHVQSCGHYLHLDCHTAYLESIGRAQLGSRAQGQTLDVEKGEFTCPLCRQLANIVLPVIPECVFHPEDDADDGDPASLSSMSALSTITSTASFSSALSSKPLPPIPSLASTSTSSSSSSSFLPVVSPLDEISKSLDRTYLTVGPKGGVTLVSAMESVIESLVNNMPPQLRRTSREGSMAFLVGVARAQLEIDLVQRKEGWLGGSPVSFLPGQKNCFPLLLHCLAQHLKLVSTEEDEDLPTVSFVEDWVKLSGCSPPPGRKEDEEGRMKMVPLLYQDPTVLLLTLVMYLHPHFSPLNFGIIVQSVFNLVFVRGAISVSTKLSPEERGAWQRESTASSAANACGITTESLLKLVINCLEEVGLFATDDAENDDYLDSLQICGGMVWSPLSVDSAIQESVLPFLRIAAIFKFRLFEEQIPAIAHKDDEIVILAEFLRLGKPLPVAPTGKNRAPPQPSFRQTPQISSFLYWEAADPNFKPNPSPEITKEREVTCHAVIASWCHQLRSVCSKNTKAARQLIAPSLLWQTPTLIELPERYDQIFRHYRSARCPRCDTVPKEPAVCLICGKICCFKSSSCCTMDNKRECTGHAVECGAGTAVYLAVNSSVVVLIRGARVALWGSLYLDSHGEEDRDLKRGRPLFLSTDRYQLLQRQWVLHAFDHAVKKWGWHSDRL